MFNKILEYQYSYFKELFDTTDLEFGFFTNSDDQMFINGNSIIVTEAKDDILASVCLLLSQINSICKVQLPEGIIDVYDERENLYLIEYRNQSKQVSDKVQIELVTSENFQQFLTVSRELQIQEFDSVYKEHFNQRYLNQSNYQMYLIIYEQKVVGEFIYIPCLAAVESIIITSKYQRRGIMSECLELITSTLNNKIYLSADNSAIDFYYKVNAQIIDQMVVNNLYGNSRNLQMFISLSI